MHSSLIRKLFIPLFFKYSVSGSLKPPACPKDYPVSSVLPNIPTCDVISVLLSSDGGLEDRAAAGVADVARSGRVTHHTHRIASSGTTHAATPADVYRIVS